MEEEKKEIYHRTGLINSLVEGGYQGVKIAIGIATNPLPTIEAMQENYQKEMIGNQPDSGVHSNYILERQKRIKSFSKLYNSRLSFIESLYSGKGNLLDIGCGAGFFLNCKACHLVHQPTAAIQRAWKQKN